MAKKIIIIIIGAFFLIITGLLFYFKLFQNLPEFALSLLPKMPVANSGQKVLILAPHSDDEVLGTGGYIASAVKNHAEVSVILATNGDGHRFSSVEEFKDLDPEANDYIQSGYDRQQETINGLAVLGIKKENIIFLGYPDGGLKKMLSDNFETPYTSPYTKKQNSPYFNSFQLNAAYTGENLTHNLTSIIMQKQPDIIFVTNPGDIHPDHMALPKFLAKALAQTTLKPQVYYYLIHARGFPYPKGLHPNRYLSPPARLLDGTNIWQSFPLSAEIIKLKKEAMSKYQSQLKVPILHSLMDSFIRQNEIFVKVVN